MGSEQRIGKRLVTVLVVASLLACMASPSGARETAYPSDGDHPLYIAHTFIAPVGRILEWTVTRPIAALGRMIAPFEHIGDTSFKGCSRERPARSCTNVVK